MSAFFRKGMPYTVLYRRCRVVICYHLRNPYAFSVPSSLQYQTVHINSLWLIYWSFHERPVASKYKNASSLWQASVSRYICRAQKFMMKKGSCPINRKYPFIELNTMSRISNVLLTAYTPRTNKLSTFHIGVLLCVVVSKHLYLVLLINSQHLLHQLVAQISIT